MKNKLPVDCEQQIVSPTGTQGVAGDVCYSVLSPHSKQRAFVGVRFAAG